MINGGGNGERWRTLMVPSKENKNNTGEFSLAATVRNDDVFTKLGN